MKPSLLECGEEFSLDAQEMAWGSPYGLLLDQGLDEYWRCPCVLTWSFESLRYINRLAEVAITIVEFKKVIPAAEIQLAESLLGG